MKISKLIEVLKAIAIDVPFDSELTDSEFGIPECQYLVDIQHGAPFVVLRFGDGKGLLTSEAILRLEEMVKEIPFDATVTNGRLGDNHEVLKKVYHDPPVTVLDFM